MKRAKLLAIVLFILPLMALLIFNNKPVGNVAKAADAAETYKAKCAMCHGPTAQKVFDPAKTDEELTEVILKGKKSEKPPHMPGFEAKGMTPDEAKALTTYMKELRKPGS